MPNTVFNATRIAGQLNRKLRRSVVYRGLVNTSIVDGQFTSADDELRILMPTAPTVRDYDRNTPIEKETEPSGNEKVLTPEFQKYFAFIADDTDSATRYAEAFAQEGADDLLEASQSYFLSKYSDAGSSVDLDMSAGDPDVKDAFGRVALALDENSVPLDERFAVISPAVFREIEGDLSERATDLGDQAIAPGYRGQYRGFQIRVAPTSQFAGSSLQHMVAGHTSAVAWADAVVGVERMRSEDYFGDLIRGIRVAGAKVIKPGALVDVSVTPAA